MGSIQAFRAFWSDTLTFTDAGTLVDIGVSQLNIVQADYLLIRVEDENVRYWLDGSTPTATEGFQLQAGEEYQFNATLMWKDLVMIPEAGTAKLHISLIGAPNAHDMAAE